MFSFKSIMNAFVKKAPVEIEPGMKVLVNTPEWGVLTCIIWLILDSDVYVVVEGLWAGVIDLADAPAALVA